jgi:hypothetical protein
MLATKTDCDSRLQHQCVYLEAQISKRFGIIPSSTIRKGCTHLQNIQEDESAQVEN